MQNPKIDSFPLALKISDLFILLQEHSSSFMWNYREPFINNFSSDAPCHLRCQLSVTHLFQYLSNKGGPRLQLMKGIHNVDTIRGPVNAAFA